MLVSALCLAKKSSTNVSQNGLKQFNGSRVKAQWFLVKKMVLTSKHNTSHVRSLAESSSVKSKSSKSSSKGSKSSSRASERSRRAKAELLRREVELSNLLKRQEVEREMERQIAGMKAQEEELRRRIDLLTAEGEIEKAKVVDEFYEASGCSKRSTKAELKPVWTEKARLSLPPTKQPHDGSNVKNGESGQVGRNEFKSKPNPSAQPWDPGPPRNVTSGGRLTGSQQLQQLLTQQQEALQLMAVSIQQGFEMPKRELLTFDGNPLNYWLFINNLRSTLLRGYQTPSRG